MPPSTTAAASSALQAVTRSVANGARRAMIVSALLARLLLTVSGARADQEATIDLSSVAGFPGQVVQIQAQLQTGGAAVAAAQNDIGFSASASIAATIDGLPDCVVNPAIHRSASTFIFHPPGCGGGSCTKVRVLVFAFANTAPIPDGAALYTCAVAIAADAVPGSYALPISGISLSDPQGHKVASGAG